MGGQIALWWPVHVCSHAHHTCHEDSSCGNFACCADSDSDASAWPCTLLFVAAYSTGCLQVTQERCCAAVVWLSL